FAMPPQKRFETPTSSNGLYWDVAPKSADPWRRHKVLQNPPPSEAQELRDRFGVPAVNQCPCRSKTIRLQCFFSNCNCRPSCRAFLSIPAPTASPMPLPIGNTVAKNARLQATSRLPLPEEGQRQTSPRRSTASAIRPAACPTACRYRLIWRHRRVRDGR